MKNLKAALLLAVLAVVAADLFVLGCKREENNCTSSVISVPVIGKSHNPGLNCHTCHNTGGAGKGCFVICGTVYKSNGIETASEGSIRLYDGLNGQGDLRATIYVDASGNFYTTSTIDFGEGLYPSLTWGSGKAVHKSTPIKASEGNCNNCHGVSTDRLMID